jgi:uncharacterized protein YkwD
VRLGLERLERRDCPATASLVDGVLTFVGTAGNDDLTVNEFAGRVWAGRQSFAAAAVREVVVCGLGGDDVIRNDTSKRATLYGGFGDDRVYAGDRGDVVYGGHGDDAVYGGWGNDTVYGGGNAERLAGGGGRDRLDPGSPPAGRWNTALEAEVVRLTNDQRAAAGLPPLRVNVRLNAAADLHSLDMAAASNEFGPAAALQHTLYGTARPHLADRLDAAGYDDWSRAFRYGENIAHGYPSAAAAVAAWMASPGHRANILDGGFTEIGVAVRADSSGRLFFTQNFGYRV